MESISKILDSYVDSRRPNREKYQPEREEGSGQEESEYEEVESRNEDSEHQESEHEESEHQEDEPEQLIKIIEPDQPKHDQPKNITEIATKSTISGWFGKLFSKPDDNIPKIDTTIKKQSKDQPNTQPKNQPNSQPTKQLKYSSFMPANIPKPLNPYQPDKKVVEEPDDPKFARVIPTVIGCTKSNEITDFCKLCNIRKPVKLGHSATIRCDCHASGCPRYLQTIKWRTLPDYPHVGYCGLSGRPSNFCPTICPYPNCVRCQYQKLLEEHQIPKNILDHLQPYSQNKPPSINKPSTKQTHSFNKASPTKSSPNRVAPIRTFLQAPIPSIKPQFKQQIINKSDSEQEESEDEQQEDEQQESEQQEDEQEDEHEDEQQDEQESKNEQESENEQQEDEQEESENQQTKEESDESDSEYSDGKGSLFFRRRPY